LVAWRQPEQELRDRNLALALVTAGLQNHDSSQVIRGYRMLNRLEKQMQDDPEVLTTLGSILLTAKQPQEASKVFRKALSLRSRYAPYEVNLATALLDCDQRPEAIRHLEHALELDPLLQKAVTGLASAYGREGEQSKAAAVLERYRARMGIQSANSQ
jgi:predicted Zn-dependent protease